MKKYYLSLILILLVFTILISGCSLIFRIEHKSGMTPEETVIQYFIYWNEKNNIGMNSLMTENQRYSDSELYNLEYVKLTSVNEETDKTKMSFEEQWFENPYDYTLVRTKFDLKNKNNKYIGCSQYGSNFLDFYLVKEKGDSDWMIVMIGVC